MAPFDRSYATFYWSAIVNIAISCAIFELFDVEIGVRGHPMSLKLVPFESLDAVSFPPSIVTVAVCEIFNLKEWGNLENQVRVRSRSLKMAPFDRPYATFYWSAIVNIALSCTIFQLFDVQ